MASLVSVTVLNERRDDVAVLATMLTRVDDAVILHRAGCPMLQVRDAANVAGRERSLAVTHASDLMRRLAHLRSEVLPQRRQLLYLTQEKSI